MSPPLMKNRLDWCFIIVLFICTTKVEHVNMQQSYGVADIGPSNISRVTGENNVYIPCPLTGPYSPLWSINESFYEASNLPKGMLAASHGLLISNIEESMNGTSFQCFVSDEMSTTGRLTVLKAQSGFSQLMNWIEPYNTPEKVLDLYIDHQRTVFTEDTKTISWKGRVSSCENYHIRATTCEGMQTGKIWHESSTNLNTISISSKQLHDGNDSLVLLDLAATDSEGRLCQRHKDYIEIARTVLTEEFKLSLDGLCKPVHNFKSIPLIVFPTISTNTSDCACPIILLTNQTRYNNSRCPCLQSTTFSESLQVYKISKGYEFCLSELNTTMNGTVIHIYESFRECTNTFGRDTYVSWRRYRVSFKLLVVLPNPPNVTVNENTGDVDFSSNNNGDIPLDSYRVLVTDITEQVVFDEAYSKTTNRTNVLSYIQQVICSPFTASVQARNVHGYSESNFTFSISNTTQNPDLCKCINKNVNIDFKIMNKNSIQVNCSEINYISHVNLVITAKEAQNRTVVCDNGDVKIAIFDDVTFECDKSHLIEAYYYDQDKKCDVRRVIREMPCSESGTRTWILGVVGGASALGSGIVTALIFLIIIIMCKVCKKYRTQHRPINY